MQVCVVIHAKALPGSVLYILDQDKVTRASEKADIKSPLHVGNPPTPPCFPICMQGGGEIIPLLFDTHLTCVCTSYEGANCSAARSLKGEESRKQYS